MKLYLSGPMTGYPQQNYPLFNAVAQMLRAAGHEVHNPAEYPHEGPAESFPLRAAFATYSQYICTEAEAILMLPAWQQSKGATAEHALATACGLQVLELSNAAYLMAAAPVEPGIAYRFPNNGWSRPIDPSEWTASLIKPEYACPEDETPEAAENAEDLQIFFHGYTSDGGIIRFSKWPEGYALWFHGEIVWRSWQQNAATQATQEAASILRNALEDIATLIPSHNTPGMLKTKHSAVSAMRTAQSALDAAAKLEAGHE